MRFLALLLCLPAALAQAPQFGADIAAAPSIELLEGQVEGRPMLKMANDATRRFASGAAAGSADATENAKEHIACSKRDVLELVSKGGKVLQASFEGLVKVQRDHIFANVNQLERMSSILEEANYPSPNGMCCCGEVYALPQTHEFMMSISPVPPPFMNQGQRNNTGWSNSCDQTVSLAHEVWYGGPQVENRAGAFDGDWTIKKELLFIDTVMTSWPQAPKIFATGKQYPGAWYRGPAEDQLPVSIIEVRGPGRVTGRSPTMRGHGPAHGIGPTVYGWAVGYHDLSYAETSAQLSTALASGNGGVVYRGQTELQGYPYLLGASAMSRAPPATEMAQTVVVTAEKDRSILGATFGKGSVIAISSLYTNLENFKFDVVRNNGALNIVVSTKHGTLVTVHNGELEAVWGKNTTLGETGIHDNPIHQEMGYAGVFSFRPFKSVREAPTGEWTKIMREISEATPGQPTEGSGTYLFSEGGVGPMTPHLLLFYTFPTDAGAPEFTALSLVPLASLEQTFNVDSPFTAIEAATSSEEPQRTKATFVLQNSGSVDCVYTIVSAPGWLTVDAPFRSTSTQGESLKLVAGTSVTFELTFDGTGQDHAKLQENLVLSLADDDYPDCFAQELRQIPMSFDHRNPCVGTLAITNIDTTAAATSECNNTVSGASCRLACEREYVPSAAAIQCIDGVWAQETCTLVEESASYVQYIVLPIGMVVALALLSLAAYKQDLALEVVFALMKDTLILVASLSLELLDIVSDCIVLYTINSREDLEHFVPYFAFFFGTGSLVFLCHVAINAYYLFTMLMGADASSFDQLKKEAAERQLKWDAANKRRKVIPDDSNRKHSVALDTNTGNELGEMELRMKFVAVSHDCKIALARTSRLMGLLALLICEDLPMLILNIMIISADTSDQPKTALLISLTLSASLLAFKMSSIGGLVGLQTLAKQHQKEAMDCLDELKKMEMS